MKNFSLKNSLRELVGNVLSWPVIVWVGLSYFIVSFAYLIIPTFLNDFHELRLFHDFPVIKPLGADLHEYLNFTKSFVDTGTTYIRPNYYPPLQAIFFLRFYYSGPNQSYIFITVLSFISYLAISVVIPMMSSKYHRLNSTAIMGIITGLFSYGLWFEIERGQFDLVTMAICFLAIYIYHHHPRFRLAAYFLFILSVNIKIYPGIFIICFTTDWQDWKNNIRRWALLLMGSFSGLFILGWKIFLEFVNALTTQMKHPTYVWIGNQVVFQDIS